MQAAVYSGMSMRPLGLSMHTHSLSDCQMQRFFWQQILAALIYPGSSSNTHVSENLSGLAEEVHIVSDLQHNSKTHIESEN